MEFNEKYILIYRKNKLIASCIDGQMPAIYLHISDLVVMDLLFKNGTLSPKDLLEDELLSKMLPQVTPSQLQSRVQQLINGHVIKLNETATEPNQNNNEPKLNIESSSQLPEGLMPAMNLAFTVKHNQWTYWSAPHQKYIDCDVVDVILVTALAENSNMQEVIKSYSHIAAKDQMIQRIKLLFDYGALVNATKSNIVTKSTKKQIVDQQINSSHWWQNTEPQADRIPVYFVPHMKNHYPLALGVLYSAIQHHNDGALLNKFQLIPINYLNPGELLNGPYKKFGPGVWLFSNYMWSIDINMQISEAVKKSNPKNITIHGGPSTPDYPQADLDFMNQYSSVDISVHGEGEVAVVETLDCIYPNKNEELVLSNTAEEVTGITFRSPNNTEKPLTRTKGRKRTKTPDMVPSPYLTGCFDGYGIEVEAAIIETNRGCPFGCTFCDWGSATNQKVQKFDLTRVKDEIDWIAKNKVRVLWIADANYGLYDRDIEMAQYIVESKRKTGFPEEVVVNYTKNSTWRLVEIIKVFNEGGIISQGIISIQTTDEKTLEVINRKNIKTEKYDELTKVFYDLKLPLSTDLMMGLPGITVEAFNKDLQKYIDMDVSVKAYPTQLLPNSPMADPEYIEKYQIKTDENDFLIASFSYTEEDLRWMKAMYHIYTVADGYGLLRYVIRYLQWQYKIPAVDFLGDLLKSINQNPSKYQKITWAVRYFIGDKTMPGGWSGFYSQIGAYITEQYDIKMDSGFETVFKVSQYCMPENTLSYPITCKLKHDFASYFTNNSQSNKKSEFPLTDYPPANFQVSDPNKMVSMDMDYLQYDSHQYFWELYSDVARPKSTSEFVGEKISAN